jgi:hypothetical protein
MFEKGSKAKKARALWWGPACRVDIPSRRMFYRSGQMEFDPDTCAAEMECYASYVKGADLSDRSLEELQSAFQYYFKKSNRKYAASVGTAAVGSSFGTAGAIAAAPATDCLILLLAGIVTAAIVTATVVGEGMAHGLQREKSKAKACFIWKEVCSRGQTLDSVKSDGDNNVK